MHPLRRLFWLLPVGFVLACTGTADPSGVDGGSGGSGGGGGQSSTGTCDATFLTVLGGYCDLMERCPGQGYPIAYRSREECARILCWATSCRLVETEVNGRDVYSVKQRPTAVDATKAETCAAWFQSEATCADLQGGELTGAGAAACGEVFSTLGDDDDDDEERLALGESCASGTCDRDLYCVSPTVNPDAGLRRCQVCDALPVAGESCRELYQCASGAYCDYLDSDYLCVPRRATGSVCTINDQCQSAFCNGRTKTCDPGGEEGDTCSVTEDCRWPGFCDPGSKTCLPQKSNGEACTTDEGCSNRNCDEASGFCGLPLDTTCSAAWECASGRCESGSMSCRPKLAAGETCSDSSQCASSYCDFSLSQCREYCNSDSCAEGEYCDWSSSRCLPKAANGSYCDDEDRCLSGNCNYDIQQCAKVPELGDTCSGAYSCGNTLLCENGTCVAKKAPGETCSRIDGCQEPFLCVDGRCEIMNLSCRAASAGEGCAYLRVCDDFSYCDLYAGFRCKAKASAGGTCSGDATCRPGLFCDSATGECAAKKTEGATCLQTSECAGDLSCADTETGRVCSAGPEGKACDDDEPTSCPDGYYCHYTRVCKARGTQGAYCNYNEPCQSGFFCGNSSTCVAAGVDGDTCSATEQCAEAFYCASNVCRPDPQVGEACVWHQNDCAAGLRCAYDSTAGDYRCVERKQQREPCSNHDECVSGVCDNSYGCLAGSACYAD